MLGSQWHCKFVRSQDSNPRNHTNWLSVLRECLGRSTSNFSDDALHTDYTWLGGERSYEFDSLLKEAEGIDRLRTVSACPNGNGKDLKLIKAGEITDDYLN